MLMKLMMFEDDYLHRLLVFLLAVENEYDLIKYLMNDDDELLKIIKNNKNKTIRRFCFSIPI